MKYSPTEKVTALFVGARELNARALFVGQRLSLRGLVADGVLAEAPLVLAVGDGAAVMFRYGVLVTFGGAAIEEAMLRNEIEGRITDPLDEPVSELLALHLDSAPSGGREGGSRDRLVLRDFSLARLQLVADVLAKSVVMDYYEASVAASFDYLEPLASDMRLRGQGGQVARRLVNQIGYILSVQGKMVGRVEVSEKPDLLWEHPELERLYLRLEDEFELRERHLALERKLELISRAAETQLHLLHDKRSLHVEWYIVILIVIAILLSLYDLLAGH